MYKIDNNYIINEENSYCTLKKRIEIISKEITNVYPEITLEQTSSIALHDKQLNKVAYNDLNEKII